MPLRWAVNSAPELNAAYSWGGKPTNPVQTTPQKRASWGLSEHLFVPSRVRLQVVGKAAFLSPSWVFGKMPVHIQ